VYLKFSTGNYGIAGKRGHWLSSKDISLPSHLTASLGVWDCGLMTRLVSDWPRSWSWSCQQTKTIWQSCPVQTAIKDSFVWVMGPQGFVTLTSCKLVL